MKIDIVGSGTPTPSPDRFGSCYVVNVGQEKLMFDCGPSSTHKLIKMGIDIKTIDNLFFTHHHYDHDVDYPCFMLTRWNLCKGGEKNLQVFGPNLTELITHRLMDEHEGAFAHDWIARINHPLSLNAFTSRGGILPRPAPVVNAKDIGPGKVTYGPDWEITAAPAEHVEPWLDSLAYRIDSDQGSIVVTGDTRPCESVVNLSKNVDTMICLCTYIEDEADGTAEAEYMCGSTTASKMAQEAGAKKLVLVHQTDVMDNTGETERAIRDISKHYDGEIIWGEELMSIDV